MGTPKSQCAEPDDSACAVEQLSRRSAPDLKFQNEKKFEPPIHFCCYFQGHNLPTALSFSNTDLFLFHVHWTVAGE